MSDNPFTAYRSPFTTFSYICRKQEDLFIVHPAFAEATAGGACKAYYDASYGRRSLQAYYDASYGKQSLQHFSDELN